MDKQHDRKQNEYVVLLCGVSCPNPEHTKGIFIHIQKGDTVFISYTFHVNQVQCDTLLKQTKHVSRSSFFEQTAGEECEIKRPCCRGVRQEQRVSFPELILSRVCSALGGRSNQLCCKSSTNYKCVL